MIVSGPRKTNRRTDQWGGSLDNRLRFSLEVLREIRTVVGRDYVVGMRITGDELRARGLTLDEMKEIAQRLAATGLVDFFSIIGGSAENWVNVAGAIPNMMFPPQPYVTLAAAIKEVVNLPILHAGKITDPVMGRAGPRRRLGGPGGHDPGGDRRSAPAAQSPGRAAGRRSPLCRREYVH